MPSISNTDRKSLLFKDYQNIYSYMQHVLVMFLRKKKVKKYNFINIRKIILGLLLAGF